jgi:hypothetical protein
MNKKGLIKSKDLEEWQKLALEEWSCNGYNMTKAIKKVKPEIKNSSAAVHVFRSFSDTKQGKAYIQGIQNRLKSRLHISKEQILEEFINQAFTDITDIIGLSEEEIKELPSTLKRQIQSYKATERTEIDRKGNKIITKVIDCKLIDKQGALKEAAKIIGAYEVDNSQKRGDTLTDKMTFEEKKQLFKLKDQIKRRIERDNTIIDVTHEETP